MELKIEIIENGELNKNTIELVSIDTIDYIGYKNVVDITVDEDETFTLFDGIISHNSASAPLLDSSNPKIHGVFPLKGKPENCFAKKLTDVLSQEIMNVSRILNLSITKPDYTKMRYDKIIVATDADCLVEGTNVVTKRGNIAIEDVNKSDLVKTHTGEYKNVIDVSNSIKHETIIFETELGPIEMSPNHKHFVLRDGLIIEVKAKDIKATDKFLKHKS